MPAESEEFNPARHEAITYEESPDHKSGEIIEVVQQGYTLGDRVLRPALVRVARG
jgi:molecular chaperone GrpE